MKKIYLPLLCAGLFTCNILAAQTPLLYGVKNQGGDYDYGYILSFNPITNLENVLYQFTGGSDGGTPAGAMVYDSANGLFYLTTTQGGNYGFGSFVSFNPLNNTCHTVFSFINGPPVSLQKPGDFVYCPANGFYYVPVSTLGSNNNGEIVKVNTGNNVSNVVYNFGPDTDAIEPNAKLIYYSNTGLFYGLSYRGGTHDVGTIFSFDPNTNFENVLHSFVNNIADGNLPNGNLVYNAANDLFYGLTSNGGSNDVGSIISFNPHTNAENMLWSFGSGTDGSLPMHDLVYDPDNGLYYAMTNSGGIGGQGAIISFNPANNTENRVWSADSATYPLHPGVTGLYIQGNFIYNSADHLFYGMFSYGGAAGDGSIVSFNPTNNTVKILVDFDDLNPAQPGTGFALYTSPTICNAAFTLAADSNTARMINVAAQATGTAPYIYTWSWGDGTTYNAGAAPSYTYVTAGYYNVCLTVKDSLGCISSSCYDSFNVKSCLAHFTVYNDTGIYTVGTLNQSAGIAPVIYNWSWGDGHTGPGPDTALHTYSTYGNYDICLTITDSTGCNATYCSNQYTVPSCLARFTVYNDTNVLYTVHTISQSIGVPPVTYSWKWGDGNQSQDSGAASYAYNNYGPYQICLLITDSTGCVNQYCNSPYNVPSCLAHFTTFADTNTAYSIYTLDQSAGVAPVTYTWSWGDGSATSSGYTSGHTYNNAGNYGVCLTIVDSIGCVAAYCNPAVNVKTCFAHYTLYPDTAILHHWYALSQATGVPPLIYTWNWGDSSANSTGDTASHTYSAPAYYYICLTITDSTGCTDTYCSDTTYIRQGSDTIISVNAVTQLPVPTGIYTLPTTALNITIYPNPTGDMFTLSGLTPGQTVVLYNCLGQLLGVVSVHNTLQAFDISAFSTGLYFLQLLNPDGTLLAGKKIVKAE